MNPARSSLLPLRRRDHGQPTWSALTRHLPSCPTSRTATARTRVPCCTTTAASTTPSAGSQTRTRLTAHPLPGAWGVVPPRPGARERTASGDDGVDLGRRPAHDLGRRAHPGHHLEQRVGDPRRPRRGVGQVGARRALRPEELLVGCRGEVDRQRVLDVAGPTVLRLPGQAGRRTASSSEIGGGSASARSDHVQRAGGHRHHHPRRAQDLAREAGRRGRVPRPPGWPRARRARPARSRRPRRRARGAARRSTTACRPVARRPRRRVTGGPRARGGAQDPDVGLRRTSGRLRQPARVRGGRMPRAATVRRIRAAAVSGIRPRTRHPAAGRASGRSPAAGPAAGATPGSGTGRGAATTDDGDRRRGDRGAGRQAGGDPDAERHPTTRAASAAASGPRPPRPRPPRRRRERARRARARRPTASHSRPSGSGPRGQADEDLVRAHGRARAPRAEPWNRPTPAQPARRGRGPPRPPAAHAGPAPSRLMPFDVVCMRMTLDDLAARRNGHLPRLWTKGGHEVGGALRGPRGAARGRGTT